MVLDGGYCGYYIPTSVRRDNKMLRLGWLLILIPSVFAVPSVTVTQYTENELGPVRNDGRNSYLIRRAWELMDGGEFNVNTIAYQYMINDLADIGNPALAFGQTLALLGEMASGYPGDACAAASLIQAYVSGKPGAIRQGLLNYARQLANNIDLIVQLAINPLNVKYAVGSRGGCKDGGRIYDFEDIWTINLASASPRTSSLFKEQYCTAKRLYSGITARSNNIAATLTASATPGAQQVLIMAFNEIANLLLALDSGKNRQQAATDAKNALVISVSRVKI